MSLWHQGRDVEHSGRGLVDVCHVCGGDRGVCLLCRAGMWPVHQQGRQQLQPGTQTHDIYRYTYPDIRKMNRSRYTKTNRSRYTDTTYIQVHRSRYTETNRSRCAETKYIQVHGHKIYPGWQIQGHRNKIFSGTQKQIDPGTQKQVHIELSNVEY